MPYGDDHSVNRYLLIIFAGKHNGVVFYFRHRCLRADTNVIALHIGQQVIARYFDFVKSYAVLKLDYGDVFHVGRDVVCGFGAGMTAANHYDVVSGVCLSG